MRLGRFSIPVLALIAALRLPGYLTSAMAIPLFKHLHHSEDLIALVTKTFGFFVGIVATMFSAWVVRHLAIFAFVICWHGRGTATIGGRQPARVEINTYGARSEIDRTIALHHPLNGITEMKYFGIHSSMCLLGAFLLALTCGMSRAEAATYAYPLNGQGFSGSITTTCDNCALNTSNITAWNMSLGGFSVSSTDPGAKLTVPAGDTDLMATPNGITFSFGGGFGGIEFSTATASIAFIDETGGNIGAGPGAGMVVGCTNSGGCTGLGGGEGLETLSIISNPFPGTVTYNFTGTVSSATGTYSSAGATVTGSFTFDLAAGNGELPVPTRTQWTSFSASLTSQVLGSTLKAGSVAFSDAGSTSNNTSVSGVAPTGETVPSQ